MMTGKSVLSPITPFRRQWSTYKNDRTWIRSGLTAPDLWLSMIQRVTKPQGSLTDVSENGVQAPADKHMYSGTNLVRSEISLIKAELLSTMRLALNWIPMINKNLSGDIQNNNGILTRLSPATQPGNRELCSGVPFYLIAGLLLLSTVAHLLYINDILVLLRCSFPRTLDLHFGRIMAGHRL